MRAGEQPLADEALIAIGRGQVSGDLLVSPISAWELALAARKPRAAGRPHLGEAEPDRWFRDAVAAIEARVVPIGQRISLEASRVVARTGHKDPGDCFLIATARLRRAPIVTRDAIMWAIARDDPEYLDIVAC